MLSALGVELAFKRNDPGDNTAETEIWPVGELNRASVSSWRVDWGERAMVEQPIESLGNVKQPALRSFVRVAEDWGLGEAEQARVLGLKDLPHSADEAERIVDSMVLRRIGLVFSIYRILHTLFPDPEQANAWLQRPNSAGLFSGQPAISLMLTGDLSTIEAVRDYLGSQLG